MEERHVMEIDKIHAGNAEEILFVIDTESIDGIVTCIVGEGNWDGCHQGSGAI
jgi:hypothetical protein